MTSVPTCLKPFSESAQQQGIPKRLPWTRAFVWMSANAAQILHQCPYQWASCTVGGGYVFHAFVCFKYCIACFRNRSASSSIELPVSDVVLPVGIWPCKSEWFPAKIGQVEAHCCTACFRYCLVICICKWVVQWTRQVGMLLHQIEVVAGDSKTFSSRVLNTQQKWQLQQHGQLSSQICKHNDETMKHGADKPHP